MQFNLGVAAKPFIYVIDAGSPGIPANVGINDVYFQGSLEITGNQYITGGTLNIAAGTTSRAPIKLTSGTNLTTPVAGAIEFDGTSLYITNSGLTRKTLAFTDSIVVATRTISTTSPLTGGGDLSANRTLSIPAATTSVSGYLTSADWNTFYNKVDLFDLLAYLDSKAEITTTISTTAPLTGGGDLSANRTLSMPAATTSVSGYLTSTDWNTFNNKVATTRTISTTSPLTGGGDLSANRTIAIPQATTSTDGYLSATDWNTFNAGGAAAAVPGSNTQIIYNSFGALAADSGFVYSGGSIGIGTTTMTTKLNVTSSTATDGITVENTNAGASGSLLDLFHNSASPAASDITGLINFTGKSSTAVTRTYAQIKQVINSTTNSSEVGELVFSNIVAGTLTEAFRVNSTGTVLLTAGTTARAPFRFTSGTNLTTPVAGSMEFDGTKLYYTQTSGPTRQTLVIESRTISTTAPLTGGGDLSANRTIAMPAATTSVDGYLTSTDWNSFNSKYEAEIATSSNDGLISAADWTTFNNKVATTRTISTTAPLTGGGDLSANRTLAIAAATTSVDGYLTSTDWNTFNNKVATTRTISTTSPLTGGGDLSANRTIAMPSATTSVSGYLTSTDWNTFNNKVATTRTISTTSPLTGGGDLSADRTLSIPQATNSVDGYLSASDWSAFDNKLDAVAVGSTGQFIYNNAGAYDSASGLTYNSGKVGIGVGTVVAQAHIFTSTATDGITVENSSAGASGSLINLFHNSGSPAASDITGIINFTGKSSTAVTRTYAQIQQVINSATNTSEAGELVFSNIVAGTLTEAFRVNSTGTVLLTAGTTTRAPFRFTSGTNLTTPVAGSMEWDGTNLYVTQTSGPTRKTLLYNDRTISTTSPLTGGGDLSANRTIAIPAATTSVSGYLTNTDWNTFYNKVDLFDLLAYLDAKVETSTTISTTAPLTGGGDLSANRTLSIPAATTSVDGYLTSTDWNSFNNKVSTTRTISTTSPLTGGGDLSANRTIAIPQATTSTDGYLSATDWNTFNSGGIVAGSTGQFIYNNAGAYAGASGLTYSSGKVGIGVGTVVTQAHIFTSTATDGVTVENSNAGASGSLLNLFHNSASPAASDETGLINFTGKSSTAVTRTYAQIKQVINSATNAAEAGELVFSNIVGGTLTEAFRVNSVGTVTLVAGTTAKTPFKFTSGTNATTPVAGSMEFDGTKLYYTQTSGPTRQTLAIESRTISTTAPLTGGGDLSANRTLAIDLADSVTDGYLSYTDWNTFNSKYDAVYADTSTDGILSATDWNSFNSKYEAEIATSSNDGLISAADWTTFNNKVSTTRTISTTAPLTGGGDLSANRTIAMPAATTSVSGYLTSTDWNTFNNKLSSTAAGSTGQFIYNNAGAYDGASGLTYSSGKVGIGVGTVVTQAHVFTSTATDGITVENSNAGASGSLIDLFHNSASPAASDVTGLINFTGKSSTAVTRTYAQIKQVINSATNTSETGELLFSNIVAGTLTEAFRVNSTGTVLLTAGTTARAPFRFTSGTNLTSPVAGSMEFDGTKLYYTQTSGPTRQTLAIESRTISTTAPLTGGGDLSANRTIAMPAATTSVDGYLTSTDWNTFNNKVATTRTISTTAPLTGGGDLSANRTIAIPQATTSTDGYLSATDWNIFNSGGAASAAPGSNTQVVYNNTGAFAADSGFVYSSGSVGIGTTTMTTKLNVTSSTATDGITVENTNAGASGSLIDLFHNSASPAASDVTGIINFTGKSSTAVTRTYAQIKQVINSTTNTSEAGELLFSNIVAGTLTEVFRLSSTGTLALTGTVALTTGTTTKAPLKFTSGTNLITPVAGSMEWDGTNLYITQTSGPTRKTLLYNDRTISTTSPLTGGGDLSTNRTIAIPAATNVQDGYLTSTDWNTFNNKYDAVYADSVTDGILSSTDWNTFNSKYDAVYADTVTDGILSSTDWNTFNNKLSSTAVGTSGQFIYNASGSYASASGLTYSSGKVGIGIGTVVTQAHIFTSTATDGITIENSNAGASGGLINIFHNSASPAASDVTGIINFTGKSSTAVTRTYAQIQQVINSATNTSEAGELVFSNIVAGTLAESFRVNSTGTLLLTAGTTARAPFRFTSGTNLTSPVAGSMEFDGTKLYYTQTGPTRQTLAIESRTISTTAPLTGGGDLSANRTIAIAAATTSVDGYLTSTDWNTFNNKVATTRTISTTSPLTGGGDLSANRTLSIPAATTSVDGYLTSTDWNTFNNKLSSTAAGSTGQFIYNNAGAYAGASGLTYSSGKVGIGVGTVVTQAHVFTSTATDGVTVENSNAGASGSLLDLFHNSASPAASDETGLINFTGKSSTAVTRTYAQIKQVINSATNTSEAGELVFSNIVAGTLTEAFRIDETGNIGVNTANPSAKLYLTTSTATDGITVENSNTGASGGLINIFHNSASPAASDVTGIINFTGKSSTAVTRTYAQIQQVINSATNAAEAGELVFSNIVAGTLTEAFRVNSTGTVLLTAGTTARAPFRFTSGTNLTTPVAGSMEFDGTKLYYTQTSGPTRQTLAIESRTISTTAPLTGGGDLSANRTIAMPAATTSVDGYLTSTDWNTFNNKVATTRTISTTSPLTGGGDLSANRTIAMPAATTSVDGYLTSTDWNTFNNKVATTRTISTTSPLTGGGDLSANRTLSIPAATTSVDGYLTSTDWNTFNNKLSSTAAGSTGQFIYNNAGAYAGASGLTYSSGKVGIGVGTVVTQAHIFTSTATDGVTVENSNAGASGSLLDLFHNSASPAASDVTATVNFTGKSSTAVTRTYAQIQQVINSATNTSEAGELVFSNIVAGTLSESFRVNSTGTVLLAAGTTARAPFRFTSGTNLTTPVAGSMEFDGTKLYYTQTGPTRQTLAIESRTISTTAPLTGGGDLSANRTIAIAAATTSVDGYLTSTDWNTFNNKVSTTRTISTTAPLTGGGDLSANRTIAIPQATTSTDGYLSSTDWNTFNSGGVVAGSTGQFIYNNAGAYAGASGLTYSSGKVGIGVGTVVTQAHIFTSTATDGVTVENSNAGASGGLINIFHNSASPAASDVTGIINFTGKSSTAVTRTYAQIQQVINSATNAAEAGELVFSNIVAGTLTEALRIDETGNIGVNTANPSTKLYLTTSTATDGITVENSNAGASGGLINIFHNSASPAASDVTGIINFTGKSSTAVTRTYAQIQQVINSTTNTSEAGELVFSNIVAGTLTEAFRVNSTGTVLLAAGTTARAPFRFTSGTNLTTPVAGSMEWDGTNLYITQTSGPTRKTLLYNDRTISTTAPLTGGGDLSANRTIAMPAATTSVDGYLTSTDWNTFNNKVSTTRTISTTSPLTGGGDLSANRTIAMPAATTSVDGYLTSTDWNTFNNKLSSTAAGSTGQFIYNNAGSYAGASGLTYSSGKVGIGVGTVVTQAHVFTSTATDGITVENSNAGASGGLIDLFHNSASPAASDITGIINFTGKSSTAVTRTYAQIQQVINSATNTSEAGELVFSNIVAGTLTEAFRVNSTGTVLLTAGTTARAPFRFTSGTNLTTPVAGSMEWDGTNLYITQTSGPTRKTLLYNDRTISTTAPLTGGGDLSANRTIAMPAATTSVDGYLTSTNWNTFNNKVDLFDLLAYLDAKAEITTTISTTSPLTGGGDLSANRTLSIPAATTSVDGYLTSTDWNTFNNKLSSTAAGSTGQFIYNNAGAYAGASGLTYSSGKVGIGVGTVVTQAHIFTSTATDGITVENSNAGASGGLIDVYHNSASPAASDITGIINFTGKSSTAVTRTYAQIQQVINSTTNAAEAGELVFSNIVAGTLSESFRVNSTGTVLLAAGTTARAPFRFTSGTNLTTPVAGSMEWDGTNLYITQTSGPTRKTLLYNDRTISTTAPLTGGGDLSANRTIAIAAATTSVDGYLTSTDWNTFNNKVATTRTISTTAPLTGGGDLSANRTIVIPKATTSTDGYLSSTDWNIFNAGGAAAGSTGQFIYNNAGAYAGASGLTYSSGKVGIGVGTVVTQAHIFTSTATDGLTVENSNAGASGSLLDLFHNSASPAASDVTATVNFTGKSSTAVTRTYAQIKQVINSATNAAESGELIFSNIVAGTLTESFRVNSTGGVGIGTSSTTAKFNIDVTDSTKPIRTTHSGTERFYVAPETGKIGLWDATNTAVSTITVDSGIWYFGSASLQDAAVVADVIVAANSLYVGAVSSVLTQVQFFSTTDSDGLTLLNSSTGANGSTLNLYQNSSSPAASDETGVINFLGNNSSVNTKTYAQIKQVISSTTNTAEAGQLVFSNIVAGTLSESFRVNSTGTVLLTAGTTARAPFRFTSGTNLTTPVAGSMEWDGTNLYITQTSGPTRKTLLYNDRTISTTAPLTGGGDLSANRTIAIAAATTSVDGYLTSTDWNTFNNKVATTRTISTTSPLTGGGDLSANRTIAIPAATTSVDGYLTSTDWNTFNNKLSSTAAGSTGQFIYNNAGAYAGASGLTYSSGKVGIGVGTVVTQAHIFTSTATDGITVENSNAAASGSLLDLFHNSASPAASDVTGIINFTGKSSTAVTRTYAQIQQVINSATNAAEAGELVFSNIVAGTLTEALRINSVGTVTFAAGTTAKTPFKFTSGTNATAPVAGAMEWDGTNLYITQTSGPTRKTLLYNDRTISTTAPLTGGGDLSANRTIAIAAATTSVDGYLTSTDWNTFNNKVATTRTISTTAPLTGGGDLSANRTIAMPAATTSVDGYLTSTNWNTFNNKLSSTAVGSTTQVIYNNAGAYSADSGFVYSGGSIGIGTTTMTTKLNVTSSTATDGITVENTNAGASGSLLDLFHNSASPAASDVTATVNFTGKSSTAVTRTYAQIKQVINSATNAAEAGELVFSNIVAGTLTEALRIDETGNIGFSTANPTTKLYLTTSTATDGITVENSNAGASGGLINIFHNSASPAASDITGIINFTGKSSTGVTRTYAQVQQVINSATNTSEAGELVFSAIKAGTLTESFRVNSTGTVLLTAGTTTRAPFRFTSGTNLTSPVAGSMEFDGTKLYYTQTSGPTRQTLAIESRTISTTAPLTGGGDLSANRTISITLADTSNDGYLSSTDWNTFNSKFDGSYASSGSDGILSSTDWNTFNNKYDAVYADTVTDGILSSTDWNTFNNKLSSTAVGTSGQFIYNNSGSYASASGLTYSSGKVGIGIGTVVTQAHIFTSTATDGITVENTNAGASGSLINIFHNSASPAASDVTGIINFTGKSSTAVTRTYAQIQQVINSATNTSEAGELVFSNIVAGTLTEAFRVNSTGTVLLTAGTTARAPFRFTSGTNLTTPVAGSMEWDGTNLYITQTSGPTRKTLLYNDRTISTTAPLTGGGDLSANRTIAMPAATTSVDGYLTSTDWNTFNNKLSSTAVGSTGQFIYNNAGAYAGASGLTYSSGKVGIGVGTVVTQAHIFTSTATDGITIENSNAGASGSLLDLFHNSASPATSDETGIIKFTGKSSTGVTRTYATIKQKVASATNAAEHGSVIVSPLISGTAYDMMTIGRDTVNGVDQVLIKGSGSTVAQQWLLCQSSTQFAEFDIMCHGSSTDYGNYGCRFLAFGPSFGTSSRYYQSSVLIEAGQNVSNGLGFCVVANSSMRIYNTNAGGSTPSFVNDYQYNTQLGRSLNSNGVFGKQGAMVAKVNCVQETADAKILRLESEISSFGSIIEDTIQQRIATTTGTQTHTTITATATDTTYVIETVVIARRTGGASGASGDAASYKLQCHFTNVSGTLTKVSATNQTIIWESQVGWDVDFTTSGTNIRLSVTGATSNNITWHSTSKIYTLGT